jgi:hypothetical protein
MQGPSIDEARAAKVKAIQMLKDVPTVVGVGIAKFAQGYCLKINISQDVGDVQSLPQSIDGVPVHVEVIGRIRKR